MMESETIGRHGAEPPSSRPTASDLSGKVGLSRPLPMTANGPRGPERPKIYTAAI